ncbi:hypothetical protein JXA12_05090 [Candidatus Woesearchaeota archaeon]|nr:hypothetical protein [Candidatus Woesearchaeota archaeon]
MAEKKMKKHLTREEEFDILKLVLDKFLWIGVLIMGFGFYRLVTIWEGVWENLLILFAGVIIMLLFTWLLLREYNFMK